jgi:hypothetical protein
MQLPVLSSHATGHWAPLQPSALSTSDYTHDVAVSSRQLQPDESRSVAPGLRRQQREMFDLGVRASDAATSRAVDALLPAGEQS